ncbi:DEAD/DEAH box helicase [Natrarchaeobius halalkaliphilus]|uniref:DEAD/DEAH box helicase n=1 Tax=Natrarchaeobius halalkaliphilus TaxID=1679091 RepID=A0A3N6MFW7_9EURY|nr:DEAD/DEAH box helicase family protein [Natrarchaeobius halalkaliphilus]RQG92816.1 DEAD/DEAH box helicase [Natrarchaeobius halalkaliphilus]
MSDEQSDGFGAISVKPVIDSSTTDFIQDFYVPILSESVEYKRGAGYFTTNWLQSAARGITELAENGGTAKWITSPILDENDWEAIKTGDKAKRDRVLRSSLSGTISELETALDNDTRNAIAWMIADGLLELKLAVPEPSLGGDFHDKFGVFIDGEGNRIGFQSSQNDSKHAMTNYEGYRVDCDWISERESTAVSRHEHRFDQLWNDENEHVRTYSIPESIEEQIANTRDYGSRPYEQPEQVSSGPEDFSLREYQKEAVDAWFGNDCRGMFQMATGTGKTFTALAALEQYAKSVDKPLLTVIAVPVTHLASQWADEMEIFDLPKPHLLFGSVSKDWKQNLSRITTNIELATKDHEIVITTHQSLYNDDFREMVERLPGPIAFIGDEVHGLGSDEQRLGLIEAYDARIGLSATPERYYDEAGSRYLLNYFDGIIFEYPLADAIPEYLTPYEYHPIIVEMTEDEVEEYKKQSRKVAAVAASEEIDDETVSQVASQRADIVKSAERKYGALREQLKRMDDPHHLLVYTNDSQISEVQSILTENGIIQHKFTNEEDEEERDRLLDGFEQREWDALVAMKCLDEGVDVPATKRAILMSNSGNPKQFIQRRGRVLRKAEGKDKSVIFDMFVVPTMTPGDDIPAVEKSILERELDRFEEFAENAINKHGAWNTIDRVRRAYKL